MKKNSLSKCVKKKKTFDLYIIARDYNFLKVNTMHNLTTDRGNCFLLYVECKRC